MNESDRGQRPVRPPSQPWTRRHMSRAETENRANQDAIMTIGSRAAPDQPARRNTMPTASQLRAGSAPRHGAELLDLNAPDACRRSPRRAENIFKRAATAPPGFRRMISGSTRGRPRGASWIIVRHGQDMGLERRGCNAASQPVKMPRGLLSEFIRGDGQQGITPQASVPHHRYRRGARIFDHHRLEFAATVAPRKVTDSVPSTKTGAAGAHRCPATKCQCRHACSRRDRHDATHHCDVERFHAG